MKLYFLIIIFLYPFISLGANSIDIQNPTNIYFGKKMHYFEDKNSSHTIKSIQKLPHSSFTQLRKDVHSRIFTNSSYWYKFQVNNPLNQNIERYFVFDLPWIDSINIFIIGQIKTTEYNIGNQFLFEKRSHKINLINQRHHFEKGDSTVYIQVKTRDPFVIPLSLLSDNHFKEKIYREHSIEFIIYSVIIAMLIFNLILYFIIKANVYLYYVLFLSVYLLMSFSYNNFTFQYILSTKPEIQNWIQSITIFIFSISGLFFLKSFLNLKKNHFLINKFTKYIIYLYVFLLISCFFVNYHIHVILAIIFVMLFSLYTISISIYSYLKGNKSALFFIFGTIFGLIGISITALSVMSILPYNWFLYKAVDFGIVIDSILLSVALANRYNILYSSLQHTEKELINLNQSLENTIKQRTKELTFELNNKKVLMKEMSHRVKNNLQIITALFSMDLKKVDDISAQNVIKDNIQRIKSIAILYEKFLDSKDLENVSMQQYIKGITKEFQSIYGSKTILFSLDIIDTHLNAEQLIPLGLIVNELITNSLKYAFSNQNNPIVTLTIKLSSNNFELIYNDNGIGTDVERLKQGVGFNLLQSLVVYQLQGTIECTNNHGLQHLITFPYTNHTN